jgi:hypothetical protein
MLQSAITPVDVMLELKGFIAADDPFDDNILVVVFCQQK